jgi:hypothetical protein
MFSVLLWHIADSWIIHIAEGRVLAHFNSGTL